MRFYTIALFLFGFNLILNLLMQTALYENIQQYPGWNDTIKSQKNQTYLGDSATQISSGQEFGDVIKMGGILITTLYGALAVPGHFIYNEFGLPSELANVITLMVWIIYIVGLVQFFANRSFKANE